VVLWLGALIYRWRQAPDFHKFNYFWRVGAESVILWLIVYELIRLGIDSGSNDGSISVFFFFCCPFGIFGVIHFIHERNKQWKTQHIKNFDKSSEAEMYLYLVIDLIQKRSNSLYGE